MADFSKAWALSASWEGPWVSKPERGGEYEENAYGAFWGTNFGLTGRYVKEFAGFLPNQRLYFQKMNYTQAGAIWKKTRWAWLGADAIDNQEIANLLFDWSVRRWNSLVKGVCEVLGVPQSAITKGVKNFQIGGIPEKKTDGFLIFTGALAALINKHPDPSVLHALLKAKRKQLDRPVTASIVLRYDSFNANGTYPKTGGYAQKMYFEKAETQTNNDFIMPLLLIGVGLYIVRQ